MSRIGDVREEIELESSKLRNKWIEAHANWKDSVALHFETRFLEAWLESSADYTQALQELDEHLRRAKSVLSSVA